jgi:hypothetical protein
MKVLLSITLASGFINAQASVGAFLEFGCDIMNFAKT